MNAFTGPNCGEQRANQQRCFCLISHLDLCRNPTKDIFENFAEKVSFFQRATSIILLIF